MIPTRTREYRRMKPLKLTKNLERKYKEVKCRECTVVVTPMDFARILGKFTKVKIQYESSSNTKTTVATPKSRLKAKENGMVHRNEYNSHPAKKLLDMKKSSKSNVLKTSSSNVLKENNQLKKPAGAVAVDYRDKPLIKSKVKYYGVVFDKPTIIRTKNVRSKIALQDLLTGINKDILPAKDWNIVILPQNAEPKNDKIYDRIAAELEDLMYNEKSKTGSDVKDSKGDEFPSILDILNESTKDTKTIDNSVNLESSDVEAMLLGTCSSADPEPMEVDNTTSGNESAAKTSTVDDNPESPSILEEPLPNDATKVSKASSDTDSRKDDPPTLSIPVKNVMDENDNNNTNNKNSRNGVTQIIFKKSVNGTCCKSVTCPKNLKYNISIAGKHVELLGAPKLISSLEDLQVLLQIVEESELNDLYVLH